MSDTVKTLHLLMQGRVQGVSYRETMRREAQFLGVHGWVRNRSDGSVEAMVQGRPKEVDILVRWAHRGPRFAEVEDIDIEPGSGSYTRFEILDSE